LYFYIIETNKKLTKNLETMTNYTAITVNTFKEFLIAYPCSGGIETKDSLDSFEANNDEIEVVFVESLKEANEFKKSVRIR